MYGIPRERIENFKQLAGKIIHNFYIGMKLAKCVTRLLNVSQGINKSLRDFIFHFNKEKLEVEDYDERIAMITFMSEIQLEKLYWNLSKDLPKSMKELLDKVRRIMNVEEAITTKREDHKESSNNKKGQIQDK